MTRTVANPEPFPENHTDEPLLEPFSQRRFARFEPFPIDCFPESVRNYIEDQSLALNCDPSVIALPALSALASSIGSTRRIRLKRSWTEPAVLWTAVVTENIPRFGEMLDAATDPLLKREARSFRELDGKKKQYDVSYEEYRDEMRRRGTGIAPVPPVAPKPRRHVVQTWALPTLVRQLADQPRGLLVSCEDLDGWLVNSHRAKGAADLAYWFDLHGGKNLTLDRPSEKTPTTHVPYACASLTGAITPKVLLKELTGSTVPGGLAGRLLMAMPAMVPRYWTDDDVDDSVAEGYASVFDRLQTLKFDQEEDARNVMAPMFKEREIPPGNPSIGDMLIGPGWEEESLPPSTRAMLKKPLYEPTPPPAPAVIENDSIFRRPEIVDLSPDAKLCFAQFVAEFNWQQQDLDEALAATFVHLENYAARLALVIHLTRWAAGEAVDPAVCDLTSLQRGIQLARWFALESCRILELLSINAYDEEQQKLIEWLFRRGGVTTTRELCSSNGRKYPTSELAKAALDQLAATGIGVWVEVPSGEQGGRPTRVLSMWGGPQVVESEEWKAKCERAMTSDERVVTSGMAREWKGKS